MQQRPNKVCPVVLRRSGEMGEILAFEHPLAGRQLVKGTIELAEKVGAAALRELAEEAGIVHAAVSRRLGIGVAGFEGQVWEFVECIPEQQLPNSWVHDAPDDGGHAFSFFWHPLHEAPDPKSWHIIFREAIKYVQNAI